MGQCVNYGNFTAFYSSNTFDRSSEIISQILRVHNSTNLEKYLGIPNMVGHRKNEAFQLLKDRLRCRIDSWSTRLLSQGGKEIFIKLVLQAVPTYTMACFLLPNSLCKETEGILVKFLQSTCAYVES